MNSFVSVDKEVDDFDFRDQSKSNEESPNGGDSCSSTAGSVVLLLPKDNVVVDVSEDETSDDVIPITVDNIPVYLSRSADGTPLFIRRYPPTMEEMLLTSPDGSAPSFDGFSEASGSTFEGFSEASRCSSAGSVSFEGFVDESPCLEVSNTAVDFENTSETRASCSGRQSPPVFFLNRRRSRRQMAKECIGTHHNEDPTEGKIVSKEDKTSHSKVKKRSHDQMTEEENISSVKEEVEQQYNESTSQSKVIAGEKRSNDDISICSQEIIDTRQTSPTKSKKVKTKANRNVEAEGNPESVVETQSEDFIGKYCNRVGCTISWLESFKTMQANLTNGIVHELSEFADKIAWERDYVAVWMLRLSGFADVIPTAEDHKKIHVILKRRKALSVTFAGQKFGNVKLQEFDETEFMLPSACTVEPKEKIIPEVEPKEKIIPEVEPKEKIIPEVEPKEKIIPEVEPKEEIIPDELTDKSMANIKRPKRQRVPKPLEEIDEYIEVSSPSDAKSVCSDVKPCLDNLDAVEVRPEISDDKSLADLSLQLWPEPSRIDDVAESTDSSNADGDQKDSSNAKLKGTLGVSKSGRIRKPSAKGSVSIEFKYLFMEKQGLNSAPASPTSDSIGSQEKNESIEGLMENSSPQKEPSKRCLIGPRHLNKYIDMDNTRVSFTLEDGRVIPYFKEIDYNLGPRSTAVGLTVKDLNCKSRLEIRLTNGVIKELFEFYISRGSTITSLVCRLFWMLGAPHEPARILSAISKVGAIGRKLQADHPKADAPFSLPAKMPYRIHRPSVKTLKKIKSGKVLKAYSKKKMLNSQLKHAKSHGKKAGSKKLLKEVDKISTKKQKDITPPSSPQPDPLLDEDMIKTRGKEGSITRGDIVYLYTQWLKNKRKVGSNVFVTDLLKDVEQLMADRKVETIRVPAGTLMSSSVKLYDEYKQMCNTNKEDAIMYLEDDWLEDIQYLVSISRPSRRSTIEGDSASSKTDLDDSVSQQDVGGSISDSDISERNLVIDEGSDDGKLQSKLESTKLSPKLGSSVSSGIKLEASTALDIKRRERVQRKARPKSFNDFYSDYGIDFDDSNMEDKATVKQTSVNDMSKTQTKNPTFSNANQVMDIPSQEEYEVEKILDFRYITENKRERLEYLVRWVGFTQEDDSWVNESDLDCPKILQEFWDAEDFIMNPVMKKEEKSSTRGKEYEEKSVDPADDQKEGSNKENTGDILEVLMQHTRAKRGRRSKKTKAKEDVSIREILDLYDAWRRENQNVLMAGGSNTVNVEVFMQRVEKLMVSKKVETFYHESLLNACFMMTLMRMRLKSEEILNIFLDSSCLDVLAASHKQQIVTREKHKIEGGNQKKSKTMSDLQNEFQELQCDLTLAEGARIDCKSALTVIENEIVCLEKAFNKAKDKNINVTTSLKQELEKVKENAKNSEALIARKRETRTVNVTKSLEKHTLGKKTIRRSNSVKSDNEIGLMGARKELLKYGLEDSEVNGVLEMVIHKIGGRTLRTRPQKVQPSKSILKSK